MKKILILGAGLAGQSASYHLGNDKCRLFEKNNYLGGHIYSEKVNNFIWDEGPHVSFTKSKYVKDLFLKSVGEDYLEYDVSTTNYFQGNWIPHPAQTNLFAIPKKIRDECLKDFLVLNKNPDRKPKNYFEWLCLSFGKKFANEFPTRYTKKYWTVHPEELTIDWVGNRIYSPDKREVIESCKGPLSKKVHYIQDVRYPKFGGYNSFSSVFHNKIDVRLNTKISKIDLYDKKIYFSNGSWSKYSTLISTLPLPLFVKYSNASKKCKEAARILSCTELILVNVVVNHPCVKKDNWIYVYDEDKYSTRINCTELFSPKNGTKGKTGIQVEVYFSKYKKITESYNSILKKVKNELIEMGLIKGNSFVESSFIRKVPFANVIFDHNCKTALNTVLSELEQFGLEREFDDLNPITDWGKKLTSSQKLGPVIFSGRYAQWKYYWTDDCVLRGKFIKENF